MSSNALNIARLFLFRIDDGDRRKFIAKANDTDSGGGPRDLRIRPEDRFWPFFECMLSRRESKERPRTGGTTDILVDDIVINDGGAERTARLEIWPHQNNRPNECRMAKVYKWSADHLIKDDPAGGVSVLMIFQQENGLIRLFFTTETVLNTGKWDPAVKRFSSNWLQKTRQYRGPKSAFFDLKRQESYCGG